MARNESAILKIKNESNTYTSLYPKTIKSQVLGWNIGEVYNGTIITLKAKDWVNNQLTVEVPYVTSNDIVNCSICLSGSLEDMVAQEESYRMLHPTMGVESLNNKLKFTAIKTPQVDMNIQVWWTR